MAIRANTITSQAGAQSHATATAAKAQGKSKATSFDDVMAQHDSDVANAQDGAHPADKSAAPKTRAAKDSQAVKKPGDSKTDDGANTAAVTPDTKTAPADKSDKSGKADDKSADLAANDNQSGTADQELTPQQPQMAAVQLPAPQAPLQAAPQTASQDAAALDAVGAAANSAKPATPAPAAANDTGETDDTQEAQGADAASGKVQPAGDFQKMLAAAKPSSKAVQAAPGKDSKAADAKTDDARAADAQADSVKTAAAAPADMKQPANANTAAITNAAPADKAAAPAQAMQTAAPAPHAAPNVNTLAVEIAAKSQGGAKQFNIRLDPPELGRVEVRLSIDAAGKAQAHLSADQPQTLDLLQKDAPALTRALREAGLDVNQDGLNFSLRSQQQNAGGQSGDGQNNAQGGRTAFGGGKTLEIVSPTGSAYSGGLGLLDIKV